MATTDQENLMDKTNTDKESMHEEEKLEDIEDWEDDTDEKISPRKKGEKGNKESSPGKRKLREKLQHS